jgi:hypothetical protein
MEVKCLVHQPDYTPTRIRADSGLPHHHISINHASIAAGRNGNLASTSGFCPLKAWHVHPSNWEAQHFAGDVYIGFVLIVSDTERLNKKFTSCS